MVKVPKCSLDTGVAPSRVVFGHLKNQTPDLLHDAGATDTIARIGPFLGDEPAMPAQDGIGRDNGGDCFQGSSTKRLTFGSDSASLIVGEEYPFAAGIELFLENSVLLDQVGDGAGLLKSYPARKSCQEELKLDCRSHLSSLSGVS